MNKIVPDTDSKKLSIKVFDKQQTMDSNEIDTAAKLKPKEKKSKFNNLTKASIPDNDVKVASKALPRIANNVSNPNKPIFTQDSSKLNFSNNENSTMASINFTSTKKD